MKQIERIYLNATMNDEPVRIKKKNVKLKKGTRAMFRKEERVR